MSSLYKVKLSDCHGDVNGEPRQDIRLGAGDANVAICTSHQELTARHPHQEEQKDAMGTQSLRQNHLL
jgi:hypothetical protein